MSLTKEFHRLLKRVGRISDGQATIGNINWDEGTLTEFNVAVTPNSGLYKAGTFEFQIAVSDDSGPPEITCLTDIYHPNIDTSENSTSGSNVCLNIIDFGGHKCVGLEGVIHGLIFLLKYPNISDPLSPYFDGYDDDENFAENVRKYMRGEEVDDVIFHKNFRVIDGVLVTENGSTAASKEVESSENEEDKTSIADGSGNETEQRNDDKNDTVLTEGVIKSNLSNLCEFMVRESDIPEKYKDMFPEQERNGGCSNLKRSLSCTDVVYMSNLTTTRSNSYPSLNDAVPDDEEDYCNSNVGHELIEIDGEMFLVHRDFNEPFSIETDTESELNKLNSDSTVEEDATVPGEQTKDIDAATTPEEAEAIDAAEASGCSNLNADIDTGANCGFESCVDTGHIFQGAHNFDSDKTKCNNFVKLAFFKLVTLFACTMKHKKLKV